MEFFLTVSVIFYAGESLEYQRWRAPLRAYLFSFMVIRLQTCMKVFGGNMLLDTNHKPNAPSNYQQRISSHDAGQISQPKEDLSQADIKDIAAVFQADATVGENRQEQSKSIPCCCDACCDCIFANYVTKIT